MTYQLCRLNSSRYGDSRVAIRCASLKLSYSIRTTRRRPVAAKSCW